MFSLSPARQRERIGLRAWRLERSSPPGVLGANEPISVERSFQQTPLVVVSPMEKLALPGVFYANAGICDGICWLMLLEVGRVRMTCQN